MQVKIIKSAYVHSTNSKLKDFLKKNEGKFLKVDTQYLFDNQYNVQGFRITDDMIQEIKGDKRAREFKSYYFLANSKRPNIKKVDIKGDKDFYSLYDVNGQYYRASRRDSLEFFKGLDDEIYVSKGIGFKHIDKSRLSANEKRIIKKAIKLIYK